MEDRNARKETRVFGNDTSDDHERSIVHIDIDCFYAQVEMIRDPELRSRPLGIQQKNIIVTSNYVARSFGVGKCMPVVEGMRLCPGLVLVRGEDLQPYRKMSNDIFSVLQSFGCPVEKLGMDENFVDVTSLVEARMAERLERDFVGHLYDGPVGNHDVEDEEADFPGVECECGCRERLAVASHVAADMRAKLRERLCITSCAGIAHNKLVAKLATPLHKPDQQTAVLPGRARAFLLALGSVRAVPGIGGKTAETLAALGLHSVRQLQQCDERLLLDTFSADVAVKLKNLSLGVDKCEVKTSGKPASVGLEDSFKVISVESEVRDKLAALLRRLVALLGTEGGGRRPGGLRLTLRLHTPHRTPSRATRHANLSPSFFRWEKGVMSVTEDANNKIMELTMRLFRKLVDLSKPFHLTLIGLAFTKFQEMAAGRSSIAGYLMSDVAVQSVMSLENNTDWNTPLMDCVTAESRVQELNAGGVMEPSPKKLCRELARPSPGRSPVGELRISGLCLSPPPCPPDVDPAVFEELPPEVQEELRTQWKRVPPRPSPLCLEPSMTNNKANTITRYFIPNKQ